MLKRVFDITVTVLAAPVLLVVGSAVALAVAADLGRPVFFVQRRPGFKGRPFHIVKFRTMRDGDAPDEERLTALGRFLRASSLDELPEFWNVLKGEMSLVGPRPLLMEYLPLYSAEQARRHEVRPGITGWAQINGRNALSWEEKFAYDVWYVDNWSLWLDVRILVRTLLYALRGDGINAPGHATMPPFRGSGRVG